MERRLTKLQKEALNLENFFPHFLRERAERFLFALSVCFLSFSVFFSLPIDPRFNTLWPVAEGLFLITFAILLKTLLIEVYFQYLCNKLEEENEVSFGTLLVLALEPHKKDLTKAFFHSRLGREVGKRLGLARETIDHFLKHIETPALVDNPYVRFHHFADHLHEGHQELSDFLSYNHIDKNDFISVSEVVERMFNKKRKERAFFYPLFGKKEKLALNFEAITRKEIEDIEYLYRIIITEKAIRNIVTFFREDPYEYAHPEARISFITALVQETIATHAERFYGSSIILPSDVRQFIIHHKSSK